MPDVTRSDSQRSDASVRPRVSFNRDVHVKRIVPRETNRVVGALNGDGAGHTVTSPVRKERLRKSKKELAEEAAKVLHQVDKLDCVTKDQGIPPEKFYTLPSRKKQHKEFTSSSLGRPIKRRGSLEFSPPKKPPRTFANSPTIPKPSLFDVFKKTPTKTTTLRRSVSDATHLRSNKGIRKRTNSDEDSYLNRSIKKQLSPIIEVTQREDYFTPNETDKENIDSNRISVTDQLKEYIDEVDAGLNNKQPVKEPEVIIIDVEKAEKISDKKSKFKPKSISKKFKSITGKRNKVNDVVSKPPVKATSKPRVVPTKQPEEETKAPLVKAAIQNLQSPKKASTMIHSSQKPVEKLPLTRGRTVDSMVKRLSHDSCSSPPPKTNILITPNNSMQHNNNQPFSYTRGISPDKYPDHHASNGIIYAQVVCGNKGSKQTIHTTYTNGKKHPNSDSDEGLGGEENNFKSITHFGDDRYHQKHYLNEDDDKFQQESPILPKFRNPAYLTSYIDRGRGDGMDAKRRESLTENIEFTTKDLTTRRDLLESRIHRRLDKTNIYITESPKYTTKKYYPEHEHEPKSFDSQISDYRSSPESRPLTSHAKTRYKSTPDIRYRSERYDKFGDSGIENDIRRDSGENFRTHRHGGPGKNRRDYGNDSEDEGFASSLLIASERQHTEENFNRNKRRDYDFDDPYRNIESMEYKSGKYRGMEYIPRERSIDDGSHYDPRLDKEFSNRSTLKKIEKKPPKPEKKSSLQKVKQLFTRDSSKKKEKHGMVREESLRARYVEYKAGGRDGPDSKVKNKETYDYTSRRRLSTPSPSPTRDTQRNGKSETTHGSWFKSLDRLSRKKNKKDDKESNFTSTEEEMPPPLKQTPTKSLRFFGDTDAESNDSIRHKSALKRPGIGRDQRIRSQSTRDLHNISEELRTPELNSRKLAHKSMLNISEVEDLKGSRSTLKPPISPSHRMKREPARPRDDRSRRRKNEVSSVESSTEGDSSQQSQRSIVYLHAATVGDIPGPGYLRNGRRAASREELASNSSSRIQPHVKTLSRSFSVLAPWKPRHYREGMDIDYTQYPKPIKNGKYEQKYPKNNTSSRKETTSTLKKKAQETRRSNQASSTLTRKSKSKENLSSSQTLRRSREELTRGSSSTLYKKKERLPRENSRYSKEDKKISSKSLSVESLGNPRNGRRSREDTRDISRSVSMPRDPEKSAGWFKMSRKSKTTSSQRL